MRRSDRLAENDLLAWQKVGPLVQQIVVERVRQLSPDQIGPSRPIAIALLEEVLKFEVGGTTWNFDSVTIHRGTVLPSDALGVIRRGALEALQRLFREAEDDNERGAIRHAFNDAMRPPSGANVNAALLEIMLQDSLFIVNFYREVVGLSFELLQSLEHDLLWLYRHQGRPRADSQETPEIVELRDRLAREIKAFRDGLNADRRFVIYKR